MQIENYTLDINKNLAYGCGPAVVYNISATAESSAIVLGVIKCVAMQSKIG